MKKTTLIILCATMIACNKKEAVEAKNNNIIWASNIETLVPLEKDSLIQIPYWGEKNNFDKQAIYEYVKKSVLNGKLKAYSLFHESVYTIDEFKKVLTDLEKDNVVKDINNPGAFTIAPLTANDLVQLRFNERIELDTTTNTFHNKVTGVVFMSYKRIQKTGEVLGYKFLFGVDF